jgi:formylglycine-generating enzyme required for sulfatase activity
MFVLAAGGSRAADSFRPHTTKIVRGGEEAVRVTVDVSGLKEMWLLATSGPDDYHCDRSAWGEPVLIDADGKRTSLTDLKPASVKCGWGRLIKNAGLSGGALRIGKTTFKRGLLAHAPSALMFKLNGRYARFEASVGIGAGAGTSGSSSFRVLAKYDDAGMQKYPKGKRVDGGGGGGGTQARPKPSEVNVDALRRAITDLVRTFSERYPDGAAYLARLDKLAAMPAGADRSAKLLELQRESMLANPLIDFDELLIVRRGARKHGMGLPANWQSNSSVAKTGYDNELAALSIRSPDKVRSIHRPEKGAFIGDVELHFDAERVLFSSIGANGAWHVFEMRVDGTGLRQITETADGVNNYDACYVPDGRVIFTSTAPMVAVPCVNGSAPVANVFRVNADGTGMEQLCFDQEHGWCPQVMDDGRILYSRWEYADLPHSNSRIMMTMNPDGTNQRSHYGTNSFWPNGVFYARPIAGKPSMFVGIVTGHHGVRRMGELVLFDTAKGYMEADGVVQRIPGWGKKVEPVVADGLANRARPKFLHPFPLSDKYFLASSDLSGKWGVYLVDVFDNMTLIKEEAGYALLEPVPLRKTPTPPAIPDKINPSRRDAVVFIHDIHEGPGLAGIPRGEVKKLRLFTYTYGFRGMGGLYGVIGLDGPWDMRRILGTVPVEADGSAVFRVPANTPISIQPLDSEGKALQIMRSWFVARPGESLSCVGCHEDPKQAPPAKITAAFRKGAAEITPWRGPVRNFEFQREVQPVLDRHCVSCHNGKPRDDGKKPPNFRGDVKLAGWKTKMHGRGGAGGRYSLSYFNLYRYARHPGIESEMPLLTPMEFHADTNELIVMLQKGHSGVKLPEEAMDRLVTWLDLNAPYHGRWSTIAGTKGKQAEDVRARMRKLYANVDENHEDMPEVASYASAPVEPKKAREPKPPAAAPAVRGWPFNAAEARRKQSASAAQVTHTMDLGDGVSMELVRVPPGRFAMGSGYGYPDEAPMAEVEIAKGFWAGKLEVTNAQFRRFEPTHDSRHEDRHGYQFGVTGYPVNQPDVPAVRLSWKQAMAFCRWLSARLAKDTSALGGRKATLPTEAQWEWACRAGTSTPMFYGKREDDFSKHGNMADVTLSYFSGNPYVQDWTKAPYKNPTNIYDNWIPQIGAVNDGGFLSVAGGKYRPNAWGLHDMHGNVAEWTRSLYRPYPYRDGDGRNSARAAGRRVARGGSWYDRPKLSTSSFRRPYRGYQKVYNVGFRVIVE